MAEFIPVDYDPFPGIEFEPVDHDPFAAAEWPSLVGSRHGLAPGMESPTNNNLSGADAGFAIAESPQTADTPSTGAAGGSPRATPEAASRVSSDTCDRALVG